MIDAPDRPPPAVARWGIRIAGISAMLIGGFLLVAWLAGFGAQWSAAGVLTVKTNTALALLLGGLALLLGPGRPGAARGALGIAAAAIVLLIGVLTLSEHVLGWNLGIDQLLATEAPGAVSTVSPNRPGPPASLSLMLLGVGLLALACGRRTIAPYLGLAVCIINLIPAVGFLYGIGAFYTQPHLTHIAWPTVIALMSLGIGLILSRTDGGPMALLLRDDAGGKLLRGMLPWVILLPLALGYFHLMGEDGGLRRATGTGLLIISLILIFSLMLWRSARKLSSSDAAHGEDEEALHKSEERFRLLFENMTEGFALCEMIWDANGEPYDFRYLELNEAWERHTGMSIKQSVGHTVRELIPGIEQYWIETYGAVVRTGQSVTIENFVEPLGKWFRVLTYKHSEDRFAAAFMDVTDRKKSDEALETAHHQLRERAEELLQANERLAATNEEMTCTNEELESTTEELRKEVEERKRAEEELRKVASFPSEDPNPTIRIMSDGEISYANKAGSEFLACLGVAVGDKADERLMGGAWRSEVIREIEEACGERTFVLTLVPIKECGYVNLYGRDITERKQAEEALRESQDDLKRAQAVAHIGSWRLDVRRDVLEWSEENHRVFGVAEGTPMTYEKFLASVHPDDREYVDGEWMVALRGEPYDIEHRIIVGDMVKWVRERAELEFDEDGGLIGGFGTTEDITAQKQAEAALRESEEHKLDFYRRTIDAATDGKLIIAESAEIEEIAGPVVAAWEIRSPADIKVVRHGVEEAARSAGIDESRRGTLAVAVGEAVTNAVKHAPQGEAALHRSDDALVVVVSDRGQGIPALALPDVALRPRFSTAGTLGMGYKMMLRFADRIYLATGPEGTTVGLLMYLNSNGHKDKQLTGGTL